MPAARLARLIALVESGRISGRVGRLVFAEAAAADCEPLEIVEERGWTQIGDGTQLGAWIEETLAAHAEQVRRYRSGEDRLFDFFVGRVMRLSGGRADPQRLAELLRARLEG
jgi:Asp-tRNA(Asn)/Glu-tRNA(Gln) amidotransferase B subunit